MGPAHSMVVNKTHNKLCIITFNQGDLVYNSYSNMYIVDPGETKLVEAASDPIGLKIALVYDAQPDGQILKYQRWAIKNDKVLTITGLKNEEISTVADESIQIQAKGTVRETDDSRFAAAIDALTYQSPVTRAALRR